MDFSSEEMARLNSNSLYQALGIVIETAEGGKACSKLHPVPAFCWPFPGQPHGGVLFTLMDTTMAWAVLTKIDRRQNCTTINLNIQYTKRAKIGTLTCQACIVHQATQIAYVRADILDEESQLIAIGLGTFRVIKQSL